MHTSGNGGQAKPNHASTPYCRRAAIHIKGGNKSAPLQHVHCHIPGTRLPPPFILHKACFLPTQNTTSAPNTPCSQPPPPEHQPQTCVAQDTTIPTFNPPTLLQACPCDLHIASLPRAACACTSAVAAWCWVMAVELHLLSPFPETRLATLYSPGPTRLPGFIRSTQMIFADRHHCAPPWVTQMIFADRHHCAPPWVTRRQPRIATRRALVQLCCMFACAKVLFLSFIRSTQMIFADRHHCAPPWVTRRQPRIATRRALVQLCCMFACAKV